MNKSSIYITHLIKHNLQKDARYYQIAILFSLLGYGLIALDFPLTTYIISAYIGSCLLTQFFFSYFLRTSFDWKSPLISGFSLCLLLRTNAIEIALLAGVITIAGKFLIRCNGKHIFNPTNASISLLLLLTTLQILPHNAGVWISPGQWGSGPWFVFLLAGMGGLVLYRSRSSDITLAFLAAYAAILLIRALWLGDPLTIPLHQLQHGGLLIFAFLMISDPKTIPNSRPARLFFAALVASVAAYLQFVLYNTNGLFYALALCSTLVPLCDRISYGLRFQWADNSSPQTTTS